MDIGSLLLGFALLLVSAFIVARPIIEKQGLHEKQLDPADALLAQRDALLAALRDLDFDHTTGKITAEDYAPQRAKLVAEGAALLRQLETLGVTRAEDPVEQAIRAYRKTIAHEGDAIETAIAARRHAPTVEVSPCPACGAVAQASDKFCPKCGATLSATCPECGRPARPADKFCAGCGAKLSVAEVAG